MAIKIGRRAEDKVSASEMASGAGDPRRRQFYEQQFLRAVDAVLAVRRIGAAQRAHPLVVVDQQPLAEERHEAARHRAMRCAVAQRLAAGERELEAERGRRADPDAGEVLRPKRRVVRRVRLSRAQLDGLDVLVVVMVVMMRRGEEEKRLRPRREGGNRRDREKGRRRTREQIGFQCTPHSCGTHHECDVPGEELRQGFFCWGARPQLRRPDLLCSF